MSRATLQTGDAQDFVVPHEIVQQNKRNYSIYVSGRWRSDTGDQSRQFGPGMHANEDHGGTLQPPKITVACTKGPGVYYCIEPLNKRQSWSRTALRDFAETFALAKGSVLFLVAGSVTAGGRPFDAPAIVAVEHCLSVAVHQGAGAMGVVGQLDKAFDDAPAGD